MIERWSVVRLSLSSLENIHLGLTEWCLLDIVCVLIIPMYLYILWNVSFSTVIVAGQAIFDHMFREILWNQRKKKA